MASHQQWRSSREASSRTRRGRRHPRLTAFVNGSHRHKLNEIHLNVHGRHPARTRDARHSHYSRSMSPAIRQFRDCFDPGKRSPHLSQPKWVPTRFRCKRISDPYFQPSASGDRRRLPTRRGGVPASTQLVVDSLQMAEQAGVSVLGHLHYRRSPKVQIFATPFRPTCLRILDTPPSRRKQGVTYENSQEQLARAHDSRSCDVSRCCGVHEDSHSEGRHHAISLRRPRRRPRHRNCQRSPDRSRAPGTHQRRDHHVA